MPEDPFTLFNTNINTHSTQNNHTLYDLLSKCTYKSFDSDDSSFKTNECPISLEEFKEGDSIIELPCNHIFNETNLKNWLKEQPNCPVCRTNIIPPNNLTQENPTITQQIDNLISFMATRLRNGSHIEQESLEEIFEIY
jgi:hypothetical protein